MLMKTSALTITLAVLAGFGFAALGSSRPTSHIREKKFASPWPVEWKAGNTEIPRTAVAWGPANSPEIVSKGKEPGKYYRVKPTFLLTNAVPDVPSACLDFNSNFTGTIGPHVRVDIQLAKEGTKLFGTEQHASVGRTLWLRGSADFKDNFRLLESYPEDHVTGIFEGKFAPGCRAMVGNFFTPDGSQLEPFAFYLAQGS